MVSFTSPMVLYRRTARSRPAVRIWRLSALKATLSRSRFAPKNWRVLSCVLTSKRRQLQRGDATAAGVVKRRARAIRAGARGAPAADARAVPRRRNRPLAVHRQLHVAHKVLRGGGGDGRERRARAQCQPRARARARALSRGRATHLVPSQPALRHGQRVGVASQVPRDHLRWKKRGAAGRWRGSPTGERAHTQRGSGRRTVLSREPETSSDGFASDVATHVTQPEWPASWPRRVITSPIFSVARSACVRRAGGATCKGGGARHRQRAAKTPSTIRAS